MVTTQKMNVRTILLIIPIKEHLGEEGGSNDHLDDKEMITRATTNLNTEMHYPAEGTGTEDDVFRSQPHRAMCSFK